MSLSRIERRGPSLGSLGVGEGDSEAVYLVRGSVLSLSFVEPTKRDQMDQLPATRREMFDCKTGFSFLLLPGSLYASTLNDTNQNYHDRDDQENMNETAHGIRGDKTEKPEDNQDDRNGLEHVASPFAIS
jgi:hypothetical protein